MKISISRNFFYHIYPLGMCGAPERNDFSSPAGDGLVRLKETIPHLESLGITAVYLGPLFESTAHGYDTLDYYHVDRRLGTNADLKALVKTMHDAGISVVLDAVLNHTGRHFFAFRDMQEKLMQSKYRDWFLNIDFTKQSPAGDAFSYEGWSGHYDLVKLNTGNPEVREHLFGAVKFWIEEFGIDGLRLDAADVLEPDFMDALSGFCTGLRRNFWLLGEVVHGDYCNWVSEGRLDSVTNYEAHKGLWSSFNDRNLFEIAWSLNRQFGPEGIYRAMTLYNFLDNHDVNRIASVLTKTNHLIPLYGLLFTIPGIPSIYYGSEWGLRGEKKHGSDALLRPAVRNMADQGRYSGVPSDCSPANDPAALENAIRRFAKIRSEHPALQSGDYRQVHVASEQFVFGRRSETEEILVAVNSSDTTASLRLSAEGCGRDNRIWKDILDDDTEFGFRGEEMEIPLPPSGLRILVRN